MKKCSKCKKEKELTEFHKDKTSKDGRTNNCKPCKKKMWKRYSASDRGKAVKHKHNSEKRRINRRNLYEYYKTHPCVDCEESRIPCLQLDHVKGMKRMSVSELASRGGSWEECLKEIEKCVVRCANCHAMKTAEEQRWYEGF